MIKPRVAVFSFVEGLQREDVYRARRTLAVREAAKLRQALDSEVEFVCMPREEIRSRTDLAACVRAAESEAVDAVVLSVPIFAAPALPAHAGRLLNRPFALVGNEASDTGAQIAFLGAAGALDQVGIRYKRVPGDLNDERNRRELLAYLRAAAAVCQLRGMVFGAIGGRSLGISTGTADPVLWQRVFAVDIEHVDQFEIVRRAELADERQVESHLHWLTENIGGIHFNGGSFTATHLERQVRSYLATKAIILDHEIDFLGVKCQPELSNGYALQCLSISLLNDPYDADGPKEPTVCSCEADHDGALTMQVLKLLSGGKPTSLNDIASVSQSDMILANCGAMATYFAAFSEAPGENLAEVRLVPHTFGDAGGASVQFVVPSVEVTLARLYRVGDRYHLGAVKAETEYRERDPDNRTWWPRPLAFTRTRIDKRQFLREFGSNHIHAVRGDLTAELSEFCGILQIECDRFRVDDPTD